MNHKIKQFFISDLPGLVIAINRVYV